MSQNPSATCRTAVGADDQAGLENGSSQSNLMACLFFVPLMPALQQIVDDYRHEGQLSSSSCRGKVEMSAFPQSTWPGQFSETASEQSCHSPHQSAPPHRGLVPSRPPFKAPKGSLDGWPRCNTMRSEGDGKCDAIDRKSTRLD